MNVTIYIIFSLTTILFVVNGQFFGTDSVSFNVGNIENCNEKSLWTWHLNIVTLNNSHVSISFNITLDRNFDNSLSLLLEFFQWTSNNEWKRVIRLNKKQSCNFLRRAGGDLFVKIGKEIGVENPKCPVPKNFYYLNDRVVDVQSTILGKFLVGKFKATAKGFTSKRESLFDGMGSFTTKKI